jgi:acyl-CoA thioesterase
LGNKTQSIVRVDVTLATELDLTWRSWDGAHGGYLAGLLLGRAREHAPSLPLRALHVNFLAPVRDSAPQLSSDLVRAGRSTTTVRAAIASNGREALTGVAVFGGGAGGAVLHAATAPVVPGPDDCAEFDGMIVPFAQHLEIRPADGRLPLSGGTEPRLTAWLRLRDAPADPTRTALVLLDALPPALYAIRTEPVPIPTVELTAHFTAAVDDFDVRGWALCSIHTEHAADGWCVDSSTLWDASGRLLATARQARRILLP